MVLVTTGLLACSEEEYRPLRCSDYEKTPGLPKTPITYTTEHLDIHVEEGLMFCAGSAAEYERFFMYMGSQLDIDLPERVPIFFLESVGDPCPQNAGGCRTLDGAVIAKVRTVTHELGHAATCEWRGNTTSYLGEGLARSFEVTRTMIAGDPREFVTVGDPFDLDYEEAGHFVRWLIEDGGVDRFLELFLTSPLSGGDGAYEALAAVYGKMPRRCSTSTKPRLRSCGSPTGSAPTSRSSSRKPVYGSSTPCSTATTLRPWAPTSAVEP
jgi:hypothetical protein